MTNASLTPNEAITTLPAAPSPGGGLVAAIAAVMNEVHTVAKRGVNEFHRYRYATMGDILKEITPLLGRHGIVIFQSETGRAMFDEGQRDRGRIRLHGRACVGRDVATAATSNRRLDLPQLQGRLGRQKPQ